MLRSNTLTAPSVVEYPDDDGLPMADNSKQFRWITTIAGNLAGLYRDREDVLVGGNMLWYAREGDPAERFARMSSSSSAASREIAGPTSSG